jgi:F-type H+-transporting ATPase subunit b
VALAPSAALAQEHGGHEAVEEGHGEGHEGHATEIDWYRLGASFFNFGLWLVIIVWGLRRVLPEFLRNRRALVAEGIEEAKRVKDEAEAKRREYTERIDNLDAELERLREEMRRAGLEERDRVVAEAARKGEKMREEARFLVDQQLKQLREDLTREAVEASIAAAREILEKNTTREDQERLAQEYLGTIRESLKKKVEERRS